MEPLDTAYQRFSAFVGSLSPEYWDTLTTEADVRMKLIDPVFTTILGWPMETIHLENSDDAGRLDYRFAIDNFSRLIVEAKRAGRDLGINASHAGRYFKLSGPVFKTEASQQAIRQLISYCANESAELACATNGLQWFVFRGNRIGDGKKVIDGVAYAFGSLQALQDCFQLFYDLLSYECVATHRFRAIFYEAEGQPVRAL
jgi:predicted type IV restriction endonuclease